MIALLTGKIISKTQEHCVLDVNGVGYQASVSLSTLSKLPALGESATLHIHTHVREDQLLLFGFADAMEKETFLQLITISGVGPKTALGILSGIPADSLSAAVQSEDIARLSSVPGIGKKTAQRIIVELKDKLSKHLTLAGLNSVMSTGSVSSEVGSALINLGYSPQAAEQALRKIAGLEKLKLEDALREALKQLRQ